MKPIVFILLIVGVVGTLLFTVLFSKVPQESSSGSNQPQKAEGLPAEEAGLQITDLAIGQGKEAKTGEKISVHYKGTLLNGTKFDSSYDRGKPFEFVLGQNQVIQGWEKGVLGMKVGGKRKLVIPPSLAYGEQGIPGAIPPKATLVFEVELLDVR